MKKQSFIEKIFLSREQNGSPRAKMVPIFMVLSSLILLVALINFVSSSGEPKMPKLSEIPIAQAQSMGETVGDEQKLAKAEALYVKVTQSEPEFESQLFSKSTSHISGSSTSMIISRKETLKDHTTTLPRGTLLIATLLNTIVSNNTKSPVVAKVMLDHYHLGQLFIPKGSKLIGQATQDHNPRRVMVTFDTLVFPNKRQISFNATALNPDGSSGLTGEYYSGRGKEVFGAILSAAIHGAAEGSQTLSVNPYGGLVQKGNIQNAIASGVSAAALEQAKDFARQIEKSRSYVVVPQEAQVLIFFDDALPLGEIDDY